MGRSGLVSGTLPSQAPNLWKGPAIVAQAFKPVQAQDKKACNADEKQAGQALQDNLLLTSPQMFRIRKIAPEIMETTQRK